MKIIKLKDGRNLSFSEYGDNTGTAVIYFHGFAGSCLEVKRFEEIAKENNYRLIAVDRPGMGQSTFNTSRTVLSTIDDITSLADYLKLDKFSILGYSGGGVFAAACAYKIPQRLNAVAIVSGMAPFSNLASQMGMTKSQLIACRLVRRFPVMAYLMMYLTRMMLNKSDKMLEKIIKPLPEPDKAIFRNPVSRIELINSSLEAFRFGLAGSAFEMKLILNSWGFNLEDINFPVTIWHGEKDTQAKIINGELYAKLMPNATLKVFENEGHHSLIKNHFEVILKTL